ncbi:MAG: hypothetical protein ACJASQ_000793 [Crocinitomicaceae bacterium]|jgi:hypothetical protein
MKIIVLFIVSSISSVLFSQNTEAINDILDQTRVRIDQIYPEQSKSTSLISSTFSKEGISKDGNLKDLTVLKIYYIYTKYRQSASFNQRALDKKRLAQLNELLPGVLSNPYIDWAIVEQTGCSKPKEGSSYFHGFVLVHQPISSEEERLREIKELEAFLANPNGKFAKTELDPLKKKLNLEEAPELIAKSEVSRSTREAEFAQGPYALHKYLKENVSPIGDITLRRDDEWVKTKIEIGEKGDIIEITFLGDYKTYIKDEVRSALLNMPNWSPEIKNGDSINSSVNLEIRVSYSRAVNGMYTRNGKKPNFTEYEMMTPIESVVLSEEDEQKMEILESSPLYLNLNLLDKVEKVAVVMDVTASMNSNLAGLSWWIYNNTDTLRIPSYTFFNDGDNRKDSKKKIGEIGGIYQANFAGRVAPTIIEAMYSGNGGDSQENDVEAVLYAQQSTPAADAILLIADNNSEVRDMALLKDVQKKVHVIICGKPKAIRINYLDIAQATGGDIIVNGRRIKLNNIGVGGQVQIVNSTYFLTSKGFEIGTEK